MPRLLFIAILLSMALVALTACRGSECRQMTECCEAVKDLDGLGGACVDLAKDTRDPQTCREIVRTIGYMLDDRDEPRPEACNL